MILRSVASEDVPTHTHSSTSADVRPKGDPSSVKTKVLETVGTLQLIDTGRRCSVRDVRILRVHCTKGCGDTLLHDAIVTPYWNTVLMLSGYHQGCDPNSIWNKDPAAAKLQHDALKSQSLMAPAPGACIACDQIDCTGTDEKHEKQ